MTIAITVITPYNSIGTIVPKSENDSGNNGIIAFPRVKNPIPIYPIIYNNNRIVAIKRDDGLNRFSKYSGIERTLEYTIIGNQPNRKNGTKNQSLI